MNNTILVVEDDTPIRNLIKTALEMDQYRLRTASNGNQAILEAASHQPDIILLDLGLPDMDGIEVIRKVRSWSSVPIIIISARSEDNDKIDALDAGADDYLTKPFSTLELLARIRSIFRRIQYLENKGAEEPVFLNGLLKVDYAQQTAYMGDKELHLTPIEYKILALLSKNVGRVLTHFTITKEIWGGTLEGDVASLRVHVATLRKKLEKEGDGEEYIRTHVGIGYCMVRK